MKRNSHAISTQRVLSPVNVPKHLQPVGATQRQARYNMYHTLKLDQMSTGPHFTRVSKTLAAQTATDRETQGNNAAMRDEANAVIAS